MRKYICGFLGIATLTFGCGLSLPQLIPYKTLPSINNEDSNVEIAMHRCVDRLNSERANARFSRNSSDAIAIIGGVLSAGSGVTSAILSATIPADTIGDDHRGQKVAAASTAGFAAVSALVGLIGKLLENSATPILRRSQAEAHFNLGIKYVQQKHSIAYAMSRFDDCALFTVPPDQKDINEDQNNSTERAGSDIQKSKYLYPHRLAKEPSEIRNSIELAPQNAIPLR